MFPSENVASNVVGNNMYSDTSYAYKEEIKGICESYTNAGVNLIRNLDEIVGDERKRGQLVANVMESVSASPMFTQNTGASSNPFFSNYGERASQLVDNSLLQIARESAMTGYMPIVAYTPFFLKRNWIDNIFSTVMMTEVPTSPIINIPVEKDFVVLMDGTRLQLPDCLYDSETAKLISDEATGINMKEDPIEVSLFKNGLNVLNSTYFPGIIDGSRTAELTQNIQIFQVVMTDTDASGDDPTEYTVPCNICVDISTHNFVKGDVSYRVKDNTTGEVKRTLTDKIVGEIDFDNGTITLFTKTGTITKVCFRGKLANRFNERAVSIERCVEPIQKVMPESGPRIDTSITIEDAADAIALQNIDLVARNSDIMGKTLAALHDSDQKRFLFNSFEVQKTNDLGVLGYETLAVQASFDALPYEQYTHNVTTWMTDAREYFERVIAELKKRLKCEDVVITAVCHPNLVRFIRNDIKWVFEEDTQISGVKLQYRYGVYTSAGDRVQIVTTLKMQEEEGIQFVVLPLVSNLITFKSYLYTMIIDRNYRNPIYTLTPNLMATHRSLEFEVIPVQGNLKIEGRGLNSPTTLKRS